MGRIFRTETPYLTFILLVQFLSLLTSLQFCQGYAWFLSQGWWRAPDLSGWARRKGAQDAYLIQKVKEKAAVTKGCLLFPCVPRLFKQDQTRGYTGWSCSGARTD